MGSAEARPAVFLDRDGTLIVDKHYLHRPQDVEWLPGVLDGLRRLQTAGYLLVVITNQSGIGRGIYTEAQMHEVHVHMLRQLAETRVRIAGIYFCPTVPASKDPSVIDDPNRKPGPGMLLRAARDLNIDLAHSWMVGDQVRDLLAGQNAGCQRAMVLTGNEPHPPVAELRRLGTVVHNFTEAVERILQQHQGASRG